MGDKSSYLLCKEAKKEGSGIAEEKLEALLLAGFDSSAAQDMTQQDWDEIRQAVRKKAAQRETA